MSFRATHQVIDKLRDILQAAPEHQVGHHLGRPFLTAYQIAIEFARRHPDLVQQLGHPIGGAGAGVPYSLSTYVARTLSEVVRDNPAGSIEGGFLSNQHLQDILFDHEGATIRSSLTESPYNLSMFRWRDQ